MLRVAGVNSILLIAALCTGAWADLIAYYPFNEGQGPPPRTSPATATTVPSLPGWHG